MVVDGAGIAEQGRHRDLIPRGRAYRRLHDAQFGALGDGEYGAEDGLASVLPR